MQTLIYIGKCFSIDCKWPIKFVLNIYIVTDILWLLKISFPYTMSATLNNVYIDLHLPTNVLLIVSHVLYILNLGLKVSWYWNGIRCLFLVTRYFGYFFSLILHKTYPINITVTCKSNYFVNFPVPDWINIKQKRLNGNMNLSCEYNW